MITYPNAKINLGLNVVERRPDGYHNLETIFYPIALQDALEVTLLKGSDAPYRLHVTGANLDGCPDDNLVVKAYKLLSEHHQLKPVDIHLHKHIPTEAGLGGGSSDCAFMIKMLNTKFGLGLSVQEMESYAARLGSDCPFFIDDKPVLATGTGNVFEPVDVSLAGLHIVLVKPASSVSTREAYSNIRPQKPEVSLREIVSLPIEEWRGVMKNDFESSVFRLHPDIAAIKDKLYDLGAVYAQMSGSGSAVYGIFREAVENVDEVFAGYFTRQRILA